MRARRVQVDPASPDTGVIEKAAAVLAAGGLVAFPTETVYGLGADALNTRAVERVFAVKGRPADNPLIVHIANEEALPGLVVDVPPTARMLITRCWPGPLTLVLEASPAVPDVTRGGLATVAVRMPAHPVALALIRGAGRPIAAPSANLSGRPSPTTAQHVLHDLGEAVDLVLDAGPAPVGVESTVLDLTGPVPVVLRPGGVPVETLRDLIGPVRFAAAQDEDLLRRSPGVRHRHYAPRTRVVLVETHANASAGAVIAEVRRLWDEGLRVGIMATAETAAALPPGSVVRVMGSRGDPETVAARLYAQLRELDEAVLDAIVVEGIPERGVGQAVMDRLRRATGTRNPCSM